MGLFSSSGWGDRREDARKAVERHNAVRDAKQAKVEAARQQRVAARNARTGKGKK